MKDAKKKQPAAAGHIAKVPMVMQMETLECGAASFSMVLGYFGRFVPLSQLRKECGISRDGSNLKNIYNTAENYGLEPKVFRYSATSLKTKATYPCILFWQNKHFVVLTGVKKDKYLLNDPAKGVVKMPEDEFTKKYSGYCMVFSATERFEPGGEHESLFGYATKRLKGTAVMLALVIFSRCVLALLGALEPFFSKIFMDNILSVNPHPKFVAVFFAGFIIISVAKVLTMWLRQSYMVCMQGKMAIFGGSSFVWHILCLPMDFFSQRLPGDIISRAVSNESITSELIMKYSPLLLDSVMMIYFFIIMMFYSMPLAVLCAASVALSFVVSSFVYRKQSNIVRLKKKNDAILTNTTMSGISMIETIKAAGAERGFFGDWANVHAACNDNNNELLGIKAFLVQMSELLSLLAGNIIMCLGIILIIKGDWSVGVLVSFMGFYTSLMEPVSAFVKAITSVQDTLVNIERVDDVMDYKADIPEALEKADDNTVYKKLSGKIELKNITFGYNRNIEPLINNINISIEPGQTIAFVGASGSGKTTLGGLITGLKKAWSGEILFDDIPIQDIPRSVFTSSVASVDQCISMFNDTIKNNISMWDSFISDDDVVDAAKRADIYDNIIVRKNGFTTKMHEGGQNFSGGECQRIEIARALAARPSVIILDEATSALDAETEYNVMRAIKALNITTIIVSHRLSVVRDCDNIIVLNDGSILDSGTHPDLMKRCEYYAGMITNM